MIFKFEAFVSENYSTKSSVNFFVLVAISIFNPEILSFVSNIRNKYVLTASEVNQSLLIELKKNKSIVLNGITINTTSILSNVEENWSLIKKAVESSKRISNNFSDIVKVIVSTNQIEIETKDSSVSIGKHEKGQLTTKELLTRFSIDESVIHSSQEWDEFVSMWYDMLKENLTHDYTKIIDSITNHKKITWGSFARRRGDTLGVKVVNLPRLYYNNLYDLSKDLAYNEEVFVNYNTFIKKWIGFKKQFFLNKILIPMVSEKLDKMQQDNTLLDLFNDMLSGKQGNQHQSFVLTNAGILTPNNDLSKSETINYKILSNRKSDLLINLFNEEHSVKLLIGTSQIFPSKIKISYRNNG